MTNTELLIQAITRSGMKREYIANRIGLSRAGLKLKIDGKNEFTQSEISALTALLQLTKAEREAIFFAK